MPKRFTTRAFLARYPDDDACLAALFRLRYGRRPGSSTCVCPKCGRAGRFARLARLPAFACPGCGHHLHPMAGSAFARSHLPLQAWFYAMFVVAAAQPRGVPATEIRRRLGVGYKTAWRMTRAIRRALALAVAVARDPDAVRPSRSPRSTRRTRP